MEGRLSSGKVVESGMFIENVIRNETNFRDAGPFASSLDCALKNNVAVSPEKEMKAANPYLIHFREQSKVVPYLGRGCPARNRDIFW